SPVPVAVLTTMAVESATRKKVRTIPPGHNESLTLIHSPAGRHIFADDWPASGWNCCLPAAPSFRASRGRLSHNSGDDVLPGCRPGCHGFLGDLTVGETVWTSPRLEPNDFDQFTWKFGYYASIRSRPEH